MEKLDQYLDQVCRTIGGPPEMRAHVRQELREHLLDAVAQHKAAGLSEDAALDKALAEFGKVEEVRSDLEAAHGQRMTWILDKAMQWKEKTMKAKWLWMNGANAAVLVMIGLGLLTITFTNVFLVPKYQKVLADSVFDLAFDHPDAAWGHSFVLSVYDVGGGYATWFLLGAVLAIGLFEWRVKSENKSWIRLSIFGTAGVLLILIALLMSTIIIVILLLAAPAVRVYAHPWAVEQVTTINTSLTVLEAAAPKKDWEEMDKQADLTSKAINQLHMRGPAIAALTDENTTVDQRRAQVSAARDSWREVRQAVVARDAERLKTDLARFRKAFEPIREAAKKPAK